MAKAEKHTLKLEIEKPQYITVNDVTYAQVDSWFGHCRRDLKLDIIYPEAQDGRTYPCILWICGGAWLMMDKSAHNLYLSRLASGGFVVASVEYRTSNQGPYPMPLQDVKAAIRYLKAHADRFRINKEQMGVMGESAGGYLTCMAALDHDPALDVGEYLEESSRVQASCPLVSAPQIFPRFRANPQNNVLLPRSPSFWALIPNETEKRRITAVLYPK